MFVATNRLFNGLLLVCCAAGLPAIAADRGTSRAELSRQARSLLDERCVSCHNASFQTANLRLDQKEAAFRGGDSGAVILPGNAAESLLIRRITGSEPGLRMPPTGVLPSREIELLRTWIDQGADWPDDAPAEEPSAGESSGLSEALEKLFTAIRRNDLTEVSRLLESGIDVDAMDPLGETPLMHAALRAGPVQGPPGGHAGRLASAASHRADHFQRHRYRYRAGG